jgi:ATP-dependent Clp protease ATP-binding subunit ClpB
MPMRADQLTTKFQMALSDAQSMALGKDNQFIEPAHILSALLQQQDGSIKPLLIKAGVNVNGLRRDLDGEIQRLPQVSGAGGDVQISNETNKLFNVTTKLAQKRGDQFISSELFLLEIN